jgi:restriction endonuclease TaqI-like protein
MANASTTVQAYSKEASYAIAPTALEGDEWQLLPEQFVLLLDHLRSESNPLHQWLGGSALFGLKTCLNEAFVIDEEKKNELIKADRTSADAIKPILFGRDVRRYFVDAQDRFVIYLHPELDVDDYPAIRDHLLTYKDALVKRAATQKWFELQQPATSLIEHNRNPKIVYPIIANECRFALDRDGYFINDKLFTLPSSDLSLLGLLNSRLANF